VKERVKRAEMISWSALRGVNKNIKGRAQNRLVGNSLVRNHAGSLEGSGQKLQTSRRIRPMSIKSHSSKPCELREKKREGGESV